MCFINFFLQFSWFVYFGKIYSICHTCALFYTWHFLTLQLINILPLHLSPNLNIPSPSEVINICLTLFGSGSNLIARRPWRTGPHFALIVGICCVLQIDLFMRTHWALQPLPGSGTKPLRKVVAHPSPTVLLMIQISPEELEFNSKYLPTLHLLTFCFLIISSNSSCICFICLIRLLSSWRYIVTSFHMNFPCLLTIYAHPNELIFLVSSWNLFLYDSRKLLFLRALGLFYKRQQTSSLFSFYRREFNLKDQGRHLDNLGQITFSEPPFLTIK